MKLLGFVIMVAFMSCGQKIYVVRHAEKAQPPANATGAERANPDLSANGYTRAQALAQRLAGTKIKRIYSTNYKRTIQTATPLANATHTPIVTYPASLDTLPAFAAGIKAIKRGNMVIVGHSNTIDNIVNVLVGQQAVPADIPETDYDNLFIITRKGKKYSFKAEKYGGK